MRILKRFFFYSVVFFITGLVVWMGNLLFSGPEPVILMYHSVGEPNGEKDTLNVSVEAFEKQMNFLARRGYRVIPLSEFGLMIQRGEKIPARTVAITFDDGYRNNNENAFPVLKKHHFPSTVFIVSDYVGQKKEMYGHEYAFMDASELQELTSSGLVDVGSHSKSHPYLPGLRDTGELWEQIYGSRLALEQLIRKPVRIFCYPVGGYNSRIISLVKRAGYSLAVSTLIKTGNSRGELFALKRIKMTEKATEPFIFWVMTSGYYTKMKEMRP